MACAELLHEEVNYLMRIEFISNPHDTELKIESKDSIEDKINLLLKKINNLSETELKNSVYLKKEYNLCINCCDKLKKHPLLAAEISDEKLEKLLQDG